MACAYQGAEMKLARSKVCNGPRPLGGQLAACARLLLETCRVQDTVSGRFKSQRAVFEFHQCMTN